MATAVVGADDGDGSAGGGCGSSGSGSGGDRGCNSGRATEAMRVVSGGGGDGYEGGGGGDGDGDGLRSHPQQVFCTSRLPSCICSCCTQSSFVSTTLLHEHIQHHFMHEVWWPIMFCITSSLQHRW